MAQAKNMLDLFQPMDIQLDLNAERPYFTIDGARTYLLTEDGEVSQNAVEALIKFKAERDKYTKGFDKIRAYLIATLDGGSPPQDGDRQFGTDDKVTHSNDHKNVLEALARKVSKNNEDFVDKILMSARKEGKKRSLKVDGVFI